MKASVERAIANILTFGDTDIFPFQAELLALKEQPNLVLDVVKNLHDNFDERIAEIPPTQYAAFVPNGHAGFRWATQIDTYWNIYLLALVIEIGAEIEDVRISKSENTVHSYRFLKEGGAELWDREFGWRSYFERSHILSEGSEYVVICDLSEFYRRINHHRLENALNHLNRRDISKRILKILGIFSSGASYGLPIGGPAARLLSELVLNQVDHLLDKAGFKFSRFADDYVIAAESLPKAYEALVFISEKLQLNQGLVLQRSKTRILSSSEYRASKPFSIEDDVDIEDDDIAAAKTYLFQISLYFDPYSSTAATDYETLKSAIKGLDILGILNHEIRKSRIHVPTINRLVQAIRNAPENIAAEAVMTIVTNLETFYPCLSGVLILTNQLYEHLPERTQVAIDDIICDQIDEGGYLFITPSYLAYAVKVLANSGPGRTDSVLANLARHESPIVRTAAITALIRRKDWMTLSDLKNSYGNMTPVERRLMIMGSYILGDEGSHWRPRVKRGADEFEILTFDWMAARNGNLADIR